MQFKAKILIFLLENRTEHIGFSIMGKKKVKGI